VLNLTVAGVLPESRGVVSALQIWAGAATGTGLLVPPLLLGLRFWPRLWASPPTEEPARPADPLRPVAPWRGVLEALGEATLTGLALWIAYGEPRGNTLEYSYSLFVPLLWIATRHGFERAAWAVLVLNIGAALLTQQTGGLA